MRSVNPTSGELLHEYAEHTGAEVAARLERAGSAWAAWRAAGFPARATVVRAAARLLREGRAGHARMATLEMGKPIAQAEAEIEKCAATCEWMAEHAERLLTPEEVATDAGHSFVRCEALGGVLAVMPWNFPWWQVIRAAAPALMAGNVLVLKHASNVSGVALALQQLWQDAGAPEGVFTTLLVPSGGVPALIDHAAIAAITLTGSEHAGAAVAARAGAAIKKVVLELGGSDPFVVLHDADVAEAASIAALARVQNNGQSCIAAKRFIVVESVAEEFETRLIAHLRDLVVGDPLERSTQVGPLARPDLVEALHAQVQRSVAAGAVLRLGGGQGERSGCFYAPTVLTGVRPGMAAFDEETFGPLAAVTRAVDEAEAIALANQSRFGLGASLWTRDAARGEALAARIEAGAVFVNGMVKSDARLPFGGVRLSGFGRELGAAGLREFVNLKTVWVR